MSFSTATISATWIPLVFSLFCGACGAGAQLPPPAMAHNQQGAEALSAGDLETAGARFNLALEYNPDFVEALANLGAVEMQRGNFARARQLLLRARRLNPDFAQAHHGLGVLAEREQRLDAASEHYREALQVNPGFAESRSNLARLLFEAGHYNHALVQYRRLREVAPHSIQGHRGFAACLLALGRVDEAAEALQTAEQLDVHHRQLDLLRGRVALTRRDLGQAREQLLEVAAIPDETGALSLAWLAVLELAQERPRHAVGAARRALELEPNQPVATYALAVATHQLNDPAAPQWLERAQQLNPDNPVLRQLRDGS